MRQSTRLAFSTASLVLFAGAAHAQVNWQTAPDKVRPAQMSRDAIGQFLAARAPIAGATRVVVRLSQPITDDGRAQLARQGLTLLAPLDNLSFFASLDAGRINVPALVASGWLSHLRTIDVLWKVHPAIVRNADMPWASVTIPRASGSSNAQEAAARNAGDVPGLAVYIVLHEDVPTDAAAATLVESFGGVVRSLVGEMRIVVAEVPKADILTLAADERVQWIEPAMPQLSELNAENRALTQVNTLQASPYNLDGTGVRAFVYDGGGVSTTHVDLSGRVTKIDSAGVSQHSTHVAGTVGGTGLASSGTNRGMAPGVTIISGSYTISGENQWLYNGISDLLTDYAAAYAAGAHVSNNSIGTNTANNGFDCQWEGNYGEVAATLDSLVRGDLITTNFNPFRVCWAAGNERGSGRCGTLYTTTAPPAGAKNTIVVGAVNSNDDSMTSFSSWGPMDDGRMRPDIVAPGCQIGADGGVTSCSTSSDTSYAALCGTSMASPTVTGIVALILQDWRVQRPGTPDPRNSMVKALLAHTAVDLGNAGPDYIFGHGSVRAQAAIEQLRAGTSRLLENTVGQGDAVAYKVTIPPGTPQAKFTIAWDDPRGTGNTITGVINDLDLMVFDPTGKREFPFTLDGANPAVAAVRTKDNLLDNSEQVAVNAPIPGEWIVQVRGLIVPQGPQAFALASSHNLTPATAIGSLVIFPEALASDLVAPGVSTPVSCQVIANGEAIVPGGVKVLYRTSSSASWSEASMTNTAGGVWSGQLPGFACDASPQYIFSATTTSGVTVTSLTSSRGAITTPYSTVVGIDAPLLDDDFETNKGWSGFQTGDTALASGRWNRMAPQLTTSLVGTDTVTVQPGADHTPDPGTICWVTGGVAGTGAGANDVDGGFTTLTSAAYDLSGKPDAVISYWRWYSNSVGTNPNNDTFPIQISNDGTTWLPVETVGPFSGANGGWIQYSFRVGDILPTPSSTVRMRFIAQDLGVGSLVEALIDDFRIVLRECNSGCPCAADFDNSGGTPDSTDINAFFTAWLAGNVAADADCSGGTPDSTDIDAFFSQWLAGGC
jgi:subtilisin family serine protease